MATRRDYVTLWIETYFHLFLFQGISAYVRLVTNSMLHFIYMKFLGRLIAEIQFYLFILLHNIVFQEPRDVECK